MRKSRQSWRGTSSIEEIWFRDEYITVFNTLYETFFLEKLPELMDHFVREAIEERYPEPHRSFMWWIYEKKKDYLRDSISVDKEYFIVISKAFQEPAGWTWTWYLNSWIPLKPNTSSR
ncbi:hypothetical protein [Methanothermobacter marburgensis]|uniref:hypothetical protein n=1 Tax=Methanothermobacter marburgensis TaxID=145263 RepID=UPI0035B6BAEE